MVSLRGYIKERAWGKGEPCLVPDEPAGRDRRETSYGVYTGAGAARDSCTFAVHYRGTGIHGNPFFCK